MAIPTEPGPGAPAASAASERWQRIETLFEAALQLPGSEWAAFVASQTGGDPALASELTALLEAHSSPHPLIDQPVQLPGGTRIGPYRVDGVAGSGGMGTVYRASRADRQFDKQVAIKLLSPGVAGALMAERFKQERQILAQLEHPNIARLLDSGVTEASQPYFVMEYVDGVDLDRYAIDSGLTRDGKLALWRKVAGAVAYAHRNLVVHRDLKPMNILVQAGGEPKLLDFGIAKLLLDGPAANVTMTQFLTPAYASPEQVSGKAVSTSTDIYALGIILYEMVAGAHPYVRPGQSTLDLVRAIVEEEPVFPAGFDADLSAILSVALHKEPGRRYGSVDAFAADVERCQRGLPVTARPDSSLYRLAKFSKRHRAGVALGALAVAALTGTAVYAVSQSRWARVERDRAESRAAAAREMARLTLFEFHDAVAELPGALEIQKKLVDQSMAQYRKMAQQAAGDPGFSAELAQGFLRLGNLAGNPYTRNLGDSRRAAEAYRAGLALLAPPGADTRQDQVRAAIVRSWGEVQWIGGDAAGGLEKMKQAAAVFQTIADREPRVTENWNEVASTWGSIGDVQTGEEQVASYRAALRTSEAALQRDPLDRRARRAVGIGLMKICDGLFKLGRFAEAVEVGQRALQKVDEAAGDGMAGVDRVRAVALLNLGESLRAAGRPGEALGVLERARKIHRETLAADPGDRRARISLAIVEKAIGDALAASGRKAEACRMWRGAGELQREISKQDPANAAARDRHRDVTALLASGCR